MRKRLTENDIHKMVEQVIRRIITENDGRPYYNPTNPSFIRPFRMKGLYATRKGEEFTPTNLYFAIGYNGDDPGDCFTKLDGGLYPVFLANGKRFNRQDLYGFSCHYKNNMLYNFHEE